MLDTSNLSKFLKGITDAIRMKKGTTETIEHKLIDEEILTIQTEQTTKYMTKINSCFYGYKSNIESNIEIELGENFSGDMGYCFCYTSQSNIKKVKIKGGTYNNVNLNNSFFNSAIEILDLTEIHLKLMSAACQNSFSLCERLTSILGVIDFSQITSFNSTFSQCYKLKDIMFIENNIFKSISFANSPLLSDESIQSIIDGLAVVTTAQTITFHATVKAKLTDEQIATINEKGWTLA